MKHRSLCPTLGLLLAGALSSAALAQDPAQPDDAPSQGVWVVRAGHVIPGGSIPALDDAGLLIRDGRIEAIGHQVEAPPGAPVVELPGSTVTAGLVDPLTGYSLRFDRDEHAAPLAPHVTARAAIDRDHPDLARARAAGILWAGIGPGRGSLFGGWIAPVRTGPTEATPRPPVARLTLGPSAWAHDRPPTSRTGALRLLDHALRSAHTDDDGDALTAFASGAARGIWTVETGLDLRLAVERVRALGLQVALHLPPSITLPDLDGIDLDGIPVIVGPFSYATPREALEVPRALAERNITLAFTSGAPEAGDPSGLRRTAALAVAHGLDPEVARRGLTEVPAELLGLADAGTLQVGGRADFVVFSGPPESLAAHVVGVYVAGRRVAGAASDQEEPR